MRIRRPLRRLVELSLQNLTRNLLLSVATTLMLGLILFIFNVVVVLSVLTQSSLKDLGQKIDLIVYLTDNTSLYQATELLHDLRSQPHILSVTYTSKDEALKSFLQLYPDEADPFSKYGIQNPLPANLRIVTESPDDHETVLNHLRASPYASLLLDSESAGENQEIAGRLLKLTGFTRQLIWGVIFTFLFGTVLMIMNAVHLSIYTRKTEIQIMQLVGARPTMIYAPFLVEGALYALFAVLVSLFLVVIFVEGTQLATYLTWSIHPLLLLALETLAAMAVGIGASTLGTRTYLSRSLL